MRQNQILCQNWNRVDTNQSGYLSHSQGEYLLNYAGGVRRATVENVVVWPGQGWLHGASPTEKKKNFKNMKAVKYLAEKMYSGLVYYLTVC